MGQYSDLFDDSKPKANPALALQLTADTNADEEADYLKLAKRYKVPVDLVRTLPDDYKAKAKVDDVLEATTNAPKLRSWLSDTDNARLAAPDAASLAKIEEATSRTVLGTAGDIGVVALKGAVGLPQALTGLASLATGGYAGKALEAVGIRFEDAQSILDSMYSPAQQRSNQAVKEAQGFVDTIGAMLSNPSTIGTTIGESAPQMLGGMSMARGLIAAAPKLAPWLAAAMGEGIMGAGASAEQMRGEDADGLLSIKTTFASAMSGAGTALFGAAGGKLAQRLGIADIDTVLVKGGMDEAAAGAVKKGFISSVTKAGISEGVFEELPQSIQETMWGNWAADRPLGEGVGKAAAQGLLAGMAMGGGFQALQMAADRYQDDTTKGERAKTAADALGDAFKAAATSALRQNAPEEFRKAVSEMTEDGSVYIDAEVLNQMPVEILQQMQGVPEQLESELAKSGMVEVKLADALTLLAGTPQADVFMQNARATPDALSAEDAKQVGPELERMKAAAERVIAEATNQDEMRASAEAVRTTLLDQINASGRYRPAVAEGMSQWASAFYTTMASRMGVTPEQFYQAHPLRILGAPTGQGAVLNEGARPGTLDIDGYHFSTAARSTLSTAFYGTGLKGSAREEIQNYPDKRVGQRLSFYFDKGTGIHPESGVGGIAHRARLTNVYDADTDLLGLRTGDARAFETAVLDAGFSGYANRMDGTQPGQVIMLGPQTITPEVLGPRSKVEGGERPPALQVSEAPWQTQASGTPEQLQARLAKMQASPAWGDYDLRIEGGELQSRKKGGVFEQRAARPVPPAVAAAADIDAARVVAALSKWPTNRDFKLALQNAVRAAAGSKDLVTDSPEVRAYLAQQILKEARAALITNANAVGWYDEKVTTALEVVSAIHPELKTDQQARFAFIWGLAVTSNGVKVDKNFELAVRSYRHWKATGRMPTSGIGVGTAASKIHEGLATYNDLIVRWGYDRLRAFATTLQPNRQVAATFGRKVGGEGMDTPVYGAGILGPKIGNGFFMNLFGEFGQLTMDRWWVRMWGRLTGDLVVVDKAAIAAARSSFVSIIDMIKKDKTATRAVEQALGTRLGKGDPIEMAKAIMKATTKKEVRDALAIIMPATPELLAAVTAARGKVKDFVSVADELRKSAKSFYMNLDGQIEVPGGARRRDMMRAVSQTVLAELQKDSPHLTMADFQALMWYPEKTLYDSAGTTQDGEDGYEDEDAPDYANAAIALARSEGVSDEGISAAIEQARSDIAARQRAGRGGRGTGDVPAQGSPGPGDATGGPAPLAQDGGVDGRPQPTGDGAGRYSSGGLAPLAGAPTVAGASGPDARLVAVAEQYAASVGIDLRRQPAYVQVDPERGARIAAAYEAMAHAPNDPAVREAYDNLARQTMAQYQALQQAGYKFWFLDPAADPYAGNPWNAMRDLRANQSMAVFPSEAGFGTSEADVSGNPLLADTGLTWAYGTPDGEQRPVLFNDLFRAVHDAFGHGLEGAGFRAQGEENAWQAHRAMFTGSAVGAITSETRGQNSWLNFGPHGEKNQTAKVEDTVFADQKTGLMPEWTWNEGLAGGEVLEQGPRGTFNPRTLELVLNPNANLSTFFHETGHFFLEVMADIASQPNAPAQIVGDMGTFLKWAGIPDLATWNALDLDGKRPYHERWAESIEQYVMEGKAPSVELAPLMRRFAAWLKSVYGSIKQMLAGKPDAEQTPLNDDIRRVMDRMLATDEQIAQANEVAGLMPNEDADAEAAERLNKRSMADLKWAVKARDQAISKLRKQAAAIEKDIREAVTVEVDQGPEMRAKRALDALSVSPEYAGTLAEHKAARKAAEASTRDEVKAALLAENPDVKGLVKGQLLMKNKRDIDNKVDAAMIKWDAANPTPKRPVNATDADVATIADSFGFESVEAMMQAIDAYGPRAAAIDGITEQRMLEEHGDLIDERAIAEAANEAVHNEARARSLATELRTQGEMLGARTDTGETNAKGSKITVNALVEAARQFGASVVARTPLRDLKAKAWQHTAAEKRAGKRWQEATAAGNTADAVKAKQDQVLNNAAAKAAIDAREEAQKILEFFKRVTKGNDETVVEKGRDADIVNAARAVLAAYGVGSTASKGAQDYLDLVAKNDPETFNVIQPMVAGAMQNAQPLAALTFEELQALHEEVQALWFLSKRSRQMEVGGDLMDVEDAAAEIYERLEEIGIPDTVPGEAGALTPREERARQWLQQVPALLRRVEQWAEAKDGKFGGPFLRYVFQPVKEAADRYRTDRLAYRKKFQALVDTIAPRMTPGLIQAPELGYTFGRGHNGIGHAELLHAILHTGNESNKRKLLLGRGWATENADGTLDTARWDAFTQRLASEGVLTPAHYDFAQGVWNLMEETKPLAQKTHRAVFGRYFAEVTADSFTDPWGQARSGGYVPAQADPALVQDADLRELLETENAGMAQAFPSTNRGFTKGRVEYNRPLKLDLRTLAQHIDKVLLFSHMEPAVRGATKLLRQKNVSQPLARVDPGAMGGMLKPWLNRSARQTVETPISADAGLNRIASTVRGRVGMALMFANVSNTLQQITGFSTAALRVKPAHMMRAVAQFIAHPTRFKESVWASSPYMADRASNEVAVLSDTMEEILINPGLYRKGEMWTRRHGYFLQTAMDNVMSPIIWAAAANQAMAQGMVEADAIRFADGTIRQTQGSTLPEDVSRFETGPAYARLFTQFVGYFNMLANTNATALKQIAGEQGLKKGAGKAFGVLMLGLLVPIWVAEAIANGMRGGPDDEDDDGYLDDWLAAVFGFGTIRGLLAQVPILGQTAQSVVNRFNTQPADDKFSLSPTVSVLESAAGSPASVYKAIVDDGSKQKAVRDVSALITVMTGLPAMAVARPVGYLAGVADDKIEPTGPVDAARGLITGTASPASKQ